MKFKALSLLLLAGLSLTACDRKNAQTEVEEEKAEARKEIGEAEANLNETKREAAEDVSEARREAAEKNSDPVVPSDGVRQEPSVEGTVDRLGENIKDGLNVRPNEGTKDLLEDRADSTKTEAERAAEEAAAAARRAADAAREAGE